MNEAALNYEALAPITEQRFERWPRGHATLGPQAHALFMRRGVSA